MKKRGGGKGGGRFPPSPNARLFSLSHSLIRREGTREGERRAINKRKHRASVATRCLLRYREKAPSCLPFCFGARRLEGGETRVINKTFLYRTPSPRRNGELEGSQSKINGKTVFFVFCPRPRAPVPLWVFRRPRMGIRSSPLQQEPQEETTPKKINK